MTPADGPADATTNLRDRIADALRDNLKRRTALTSNPFPSTIGGGIGLTEYDLADITLAVVHPELEQLRAQLAEAHHGHLKTFLAEHPGAADPVRRVDGKPVLDQPVYAVSRELIQVFLDERAEAAGQLRDAELATEEAHGQTTRLAQTLTEILDRYRPLTDEHQITFAWTALLVPDAQYARWRTVLDTAAPRPADGPSTPVTAPADERPLTPADGRCETRGAHGPELVTLPRRTRLRPGLIRDLIDSAHRARADQATAIAAAGLEPFPHDDDTPPELAAHRCRSYEVDGEPVALHGGQDLDDGEHPEDGEQR